MAAVFLAMLEAGARETRATRVVVPFVVEALAAGSVVRLTRMVVAGTLVAEARGRDRVDVIEATPVVRDAMVDATVAAARETRRVDEAVAVGAVVVTEGRGTARVELVIERGLEVDEAGTVRRTAPAVTVDVAIGRLTMDPVAALPLMVGVLEGVGRG